MLFIIFKVQMISTQQVVQFHCLQIIRIYKQLTDPMDSMADPLFSSYSAHLPNTKSKYLILSRVVPLSRGKSFFLSWCPFVPGQGQEQMSRDKTLCPGTSWDKMG